MPGLVMVSTTRRQLQTFVPRHRSNPTTNLPFLDGNAHRPAHYSFGRIAVSLPQKPPESPFTTLNSSSKTASCEL
jgi:hypothetical protein